MRYPVTRCTAPGSVPVPPTVLQSLAPGQVIFQDVDFTEFDIFQPGQCHFGNTTALEIQVGDELHSHRVRCSTPASVEVVP